MSWNRKYYVGTHVNPDVYQASSSGGAFTAITDAVFEEKPDAIIWGAGWSDNLHVVHKRATTPQERNGLRGSKYVLSDASQAYRGVKTDLLANRFVVFVGTPCQIAAMSLYLQREKVDASELLKISFICHGVASERFFRDYISHLEEHYGASATSISFRAKSKPGKLQDMRVEFSNGRVYQAASTSSDWFYSIYMRNLPIRESCFRCPFAGPKRPSDIDIADAWGYGEMDGQAASLLIANNERGERWIQECADILQLREIDETQVDQPQLSTFKPTPKPMSYDEFWNIYEHKGYMGVQRWIGNDTPKGKMKAAAAKAVDALDLRRFRKG